MHASIIYLVSICCQSVAFRLQIEKLSHCDLVRMENKVENAIFSSLFRLRELFCSQYSQSPNEFRSFLSASYVMHYDDISTKRNFLSTFHYRHETPAPRKFQLDALFEISVRRE